MPTLRCTLRSIVGACARAREFLYHDADAATRGQSRLAAAVIVLESPKTARAMSPSRPHLKSITGARLLASRRLRDASALAFKESGMSKVNVKKYALLCQRLAAECSLADFSAHASGRSMVVDVGHEIGSERPCSVSRG